MDGSLKNFPVFVFLVTRQAFGGFVAGRGRRKIEHRAPRRILDMSRPRAVAPFAAPEGRGETRIIHGLPHGGHHEGVVFILVTSLASVRTHVL